MAVLLPDKEKYKLGKLHFFHCLRVMCNPPLKANYCMMVIKNIGTILKIYGFQDMRVSSNDETR